MRPGAAASLREGLHETLNAASAVDACVALPPRHRSRCSAAGAVAHVTRFRDGDIALTLYRGGRVRRRRVRRIKGQRELELLRAALAAHVDAEDDKNGRIG